MHNIVIISPAMGTQINVLASKFVFNENMQKVLAAIS